MLARDVSFFFVVYQIWKFVIFFHFLGFFVIIQLFKGLVVLRFFMR